MPLQQAGSAPPGAVPECDTVLTLDYFAGGDMLSVRTKGHAPPGTGLLEVYFPPECVPDDGFSLADATNLFSIGAEGDAPDGVQVFLEFKRHQARVDVPNANSLILG